MKLPRVGLVAAAVLLAVTLPDGGRPALGAPSQERLVLALERATSGPSRYDLTVWMGFGTKGAFVGAIHAKVSRGRIIRVYGTATSAGRENGPSAKVGDQQVDSCDQAGVCRGPGVLAHSSSADSPEGGGPYNRLYVAAWGSNIRFDLDASGWRLRPVDWNFRFVDGMESDSLWATAGYEAEVFFDARAKGGHDGSIAIATAPCSTATVGVPKGVGKVVLDGGIEQESITCPSDLSPKVGSWAHERTNWHLHGLAAGQTNLARTRLFVLDLPNEF